MTALINLDNPIFWTPPGAHSAALSVMKPPHLARRQLPQAVTAASQHHASTGADEARGCPSASRAWTPNNAILISSDEESVVNDDDEDDGRHDFNVDGSHPDDSLPSIATIAAAIATERCEENTDPRESETAETTRNPVCAVHLASINQDGQLLQGHHRQFHPSATLPMPCPWRPPRSRQNHP
ncbi:hypothetical protein HIM_11556 [Hirsutella minnesotensis 3608]|uniref:Uncharacterized protein n=1 Tax=Hirsutella minnesotensis 3608 TaxID=1043627 RepID=A0A0F7ZIY8_9HYPO|nr:hypothetical protein HIM_11556 [Hirsutella minnesotensis 3608]